MLPDTSRPLILFSMLGLLTGGCGSLQDTPPDSSPYRIVVTDGDLAWTVHQKGDTNTLTAVGLRTFTSSTVSSRLRKTRCGRNWAALQDAPPGVALAIQPAVPIEAPAPTARVSNVQTERAQWRLDAIAGIPPSTSPSPAIIRSVRKHRRPNAPPVFVVSGDYECTGLLALVDAELRQVLAHARFPLPGPRCAPFVVHPPADFDADGRLEWLVRAGRETNGEGVFRAIVHLEFGDDPSIETLWTDRLEGDCETASTREDSPPTHRVLQAVAASRSLGSFP